MILATALAGAAGAQSAAEGAVAPAPGQVAADRPPGGFTFHMVKPPKPGATRRIMVQVDPEVQRRWIENAPDVATHKTKDPTQTPVTTPDQAPAGAVAKTETVPAPQRYGWFWQAISPKMGQGNGRLQKALDVLSGPPGGNRVAAPRLQHMQDMARKWGQKILKATLGTRVSPALVLAVMGVESGGRPQAVSPKGAHGLMQLIPATADRFGVDATDPKQNIQGAVAYLDWLMGEFNNDPLMVLAAYNAGENAVKAASGVPDYAETRDYVPKVLAAWKVARGLCATPPDLISDGCVFKVIAAGDKQAGADGTGAAADGAPIRKVN
ncbi:lytic transglycosylase domain-containing protein [Acidimangrovimonas pyrenivorans]|uniref:Lytic transglycosylase domain-containing protein n=1 Tax=Acidimangrovimonas pyrenivorans TaxID=2030798 RepID=A0ABV7ALS8_9RHOB